MTYPNYKVIHRPDSALEIAKISDRILRDAGAVGILPTPIDDLIQVAKVKDESKTHGIIERFASTLSEEGLNFFRSSLQKIRGIADIREKVIYVPQDTAPRVLFVKAHELGHEVLLWQKVNTSITTPLYCDNDLTLKSDTQELFDVEANFFASEVIFQGKRFTHLARAYKPSFDAVFKIADDHGASKQATLHRYIEVQDEIVATVSYLPSQYETDGDGRSILRSPWLIGSPRFLQYYKDVQLPDRIHTGHPWVEARNSGLICSDEINLNCGNIPIRFEWHAWWNTYSLLVLLRRRPILSFSRFIQRSK